MAKRVVVALVAVAFPRMFKFPLIVEDAPERRPPLKVRSDVVAFPGNGSWSVAPVASVPHERTPAGDAFTSQDAAFKFESMSCEVEAVPETARFVVVALVVVVFVKMLPAVQVLDEYVFGMVVDASMKAIAEVVDQLSPAAVKYCDDVVEKKLFTFFQASALVVENERPTEVKYAAELVEKKSRAFFHASLEVVENARPTDEKYVADDVEKKFAVFFHASADVVENESPAEVK